MADDRSTLALIPARGGSKGVPRKNVRPLCGRPLIAWTIEAALGSGYIDRVVVSTEDEEIAAIACNCGAEVPFLRPAELARDDTPGIEVVLHTLRQLAQRFDRVIVLQPTSPLRTATDIDRALRKQAEAKAPFCVSVTRPKHHPCWSLRADSEGFLRPLLPELPNRRQDLPPVYALNGAIYIAETQALIRQRSFLGEPLLGYEMPPERSLDIDTELDFAIAELLMMKRTHP